MIDREVNLIIDFLLLKSQLLHKYVKFILRLIINKNN